MTHKGRSVLSVGRTTSLVSFVTETQAGRGCSQAGGDGRRPGTEAHVTNKGRTVLSVDESGGGTDGCLTLRMELVERLRSG